MAPSKQEGILCDIQTAVFNPPRHPPHRKILHSRIHAYLSRIRYVLWNIVAVTLFYLVQDSSLNRHLADNQIHFNIIFHSIQLLSIFLFFLTARSKPGYVPLLRDEEDSTSLLSGDEPHVHSEQSEIPVNVNGSLPPNFCASCQFIRPIRSKHCYDCGRCVIKYNHHCSMTGTCIGAKNHRHFLLYIMLQTVVVNWALFMVVHNMLQNVVYFKDMSVEQWVWRLLNFLCIFKAFTMIGGLCGYHVYLAATNQTVFERMQPWVLMQWNHEKGAFDEELNLEESKVDGCTRRGSSELELPRDDELEMISFDEGFIENVRTFVFGSVKQEWSNAYMCLLEDNESNIDDSAVDEDSF